VPHAPPAWPTPDVVMAMLALGLVSGALAYVLYFRLIADLESKARRAVHGYGVCSDEALSDDGRSTLTDASTHRPIRTSQMISRSHAGTPPLGAKPPRAVNIGAAQSRGNLLPRLTR